MSKASDRVQHVNLLAEVAAVGIGGLVLAWFSDYFSQRTQQVIIGDTKDNVSPCTRGCLKVLFKVFSYFEFTSIMPHVSTELLCAVLC